MCVHFYGHLRHRVCIFMVREAYPRKRGGRELHTTPSEVPGACPVPCYADTAPGAWLGAMTDGKVPGAVS